AFFFTSRRRHTSFSRDWSSDVCSSDLVWISGLMKWQSDHRATLDIIEMRGGILKFYPLLDVTKEEREAFIAENKLPFHPLVSKRSEERRVGNEWRCR